MKKAPFPLSLSVPTLGGGYVITGGYPDFLYLRYTP